jgi:hypothetical protein
VTQDQADLRRIWNRKTFSILTKVKQSWPCRGILSRKRISSSGRRYSLCDPDERLTCGAFCWTITLFVNFVNTTNIRISENINRHKVLLKQQHSMSIVVIQLPLSTCKNIFLYKYLQLFVQFNLSRFLNAGPMEFKEQIRICRNLYDHDSIEKCWSFSQFLCPFEDTLV